MWELRKAIRSREHPCGRPRYCRWILLWGRSDGDNGGNGDVTDFWNAEDAGGRSYWYGSGSVSYRRELSGREKAFVGSACVSSYSATTERAEREIAAGTLPALAADVENFDEYEIIFVGYPIWWDTTPPVVNTFLNSHEFSGKTVVPFCTSGGSGIRGSLTNINQYCTGATVLSGRDLSGANAQEVSQWLTQIGMIG